MVYAIKILNNEKRKLQNNINWIIETKKGLETKCKIDVKIKCIEKAIKSLKEAETSENKH